VSLPDLPSTFRQPTPDERPWSWRLLDVLGGDATVSEEYADQQFANQGVAESWIGEVWRELVDQGVDAVILLESERQVYGPMSLRA
jgi:hypothetical protein